MSNKRFMVAIGVMTLISGCAGPIGEGSHMANSQPSSISQETSNKYQLPKNNSWNVIVHETDNPIRTHGISSDMLYVIIAPGEQSWNVVGFFEQRPNIKAGEEIFAASKDLRTWQTTIDGWEPVCKEGQSGYSVCNSSLSKKDWTVFAAGAALTLGLSAITKKPPVEYDVSAVKNAVNSIPEAQAREMLAKFNEAQLQIAKKRNAEQKIAYQKAKATQEIENQKQAQIRAQLIKKRKDAPVGAKDFCKVRVVGSLVWIVKNGIYDCETYGEVFTNEMPQEGWVIVNKVPRQLDNNTIYDVVIEKAKR
jgi:hypothetical protein